MKKFIKYPVTAAIASELDALHSDNVKDRAVLALFTNDPEILSELAKDEDEHVRENVASRGDEFALPVELADDESWQVRRTLAEKTKDERLLAKLADDEDWPTREIVARRTNDPKVKMKLADDPMTQVREIILYRDADKIDVLRKFINDPSESLSRYAKKRLKSKSSSATDDVSYYDVTSEDPADWIIDYDWFFELIDNCLASLGIEVEDYDEEDTRGGRICTYTLDNGTVLDSYELETELLSELNSKTIKKSQIKSFIKKYISNL